MSGLHPDEVYCICPAEVIRFAKACGHARADEVKAMLRAAHFGATLERAKKIEPFDKYFKKNDGRSLNERLKSAISAAAVQSKG